MSSLARSRRRRRSLLNPWSVAAAVAILGISVALTVAVRNDTSAKRTERAAVVLTGEKSAMGTPVIETPGRARGSASAGSVEVAAANWALGQVALNTAVRPIWVLRNTGTEAVTIGEPHPEVRKGCCPGPFTIGSRAIPPGGETTLTFELSMHPGMDGWHDFAVHVPVQSGGREDTLTLGVNGDFRDA